MDVFSRFKHLTLSSTESASTPRELVQISIKIKADYVCFIDRFAESLNISRNEMLNHLIKGALPDAVMAFYDGFSHNPLNEMGFSDFVEKVISGEYYFFEPTEDQLAADNLHNFNLEYSK